MDISSEILIPKNSTQLIILSLPVSTLGKSKKEKKDWPKKRFP